MPHFEWLALAQRGSPVTDRAWVRVLLGIALAAVVAAVVLLVVD